MPPIHLLNELRYLVPSQFESKLLRSKTYNTDLRWTDKAKKNGLLFDLSRVEWVEFGTLVQLVLLVESALIGGVSVAVALPIPERRYSEQEWVDSETIDGADEAVAYQVTRRRKVLRFLDYLGFTSAIQADHLHAFKENLSILPNYDASGPLIKGKPHSASVKTPVPTLDSEPTKLYESFFPLTWLSKGDDANTVKISKFLAGIVGQRQRGLEAIDAEAISNVILYELIDNVASHAGGSGHALVAAWARREGWVYDKDHYIDCEQPFMEWLSQRQSSSVEIVVGDSGKGVPKALEGPFDVSTAFKGRSFTTRKRKATQILQWAFDRWSTSRKNKGLRGTRGLYRVDRVVNKYQGLVTLRSENAMAGRDHGGASYDEPISATQGLSSIPGTIMRCRMPSFHEDSSPRITTDRVPREMGFDLIHLGIVGSHGIEKDIARKLEERLGAAQIDNPLCALAIVEDAGSPKAAVEPTLRQCVETRHPGTLVVLGLPGGWELIEGAIDSINSEHEKQARGTESARTKSFKIWDPVLVIGPQGQFAWVGADKPAKAILEYLLESSEGTISVETLRALLPDDKVRASTLKYFRSDTNLIRFREESLELLVTGAEIVAFTLKQINGYLKPGERQGILAGRVFRTPSLLLVNRWLDVGKIVERSCGDELLMFALSEMVKRSDAWTQLGPANTILADSTVSAIHLGKLREYLGTDVEQQTIPGETGAPVLPGSKVLPDGARVVVYCDVIAASEAVGRCLRQIRREGAEAVAVACVIDARQTRGKSLILHDMEVPIIRLTTLDLVVSEKTEEPIANINPITRRVEESVSGPLTYDISRPALDDLIRENKALHFSHIGRPIGRHFTFYLNALPFGIPLISQTFDRVINGVLEEWNSSNSQTLDSPQIELWHPAPEPKPSEPARHFAEMIKVQRKDVALIKTIHRESAYGRWVFPGTQGNFVTHPTVVVVDWGALTGTTVMQIMRLAAEAGARRILVCIFLSQLERDEEAFLRSIKMLRVKSTSSVFPFERAKSLPFENPDPVESCPEVIVKFLSGFPIEAYTRYECPVCQQLDRLSQEKYPTTLLKNFAINQEAVRLRLRDRKDLQDKDPKDFDNNPISSDSLLSMVAFRGILVEALTSTQSRVVVATRIRAMLADARSTEFPSSEILSFLHFLSVESQWLRRPPLYFRDLRDTIAELALLVALNSRVPEGDRLNATIVLRTSNKSLFARKFSTLFRALSESESLLKQLLYDAFTYLTRPYHQTSTVFEPLRDGLREVQTEIGDRRISLLGSDAGPISETIELLSMRAETELAKAGVSQDTPPQSWSKLHNIFSAENYRGHDSVPKAINWMIPGYDSEVIEQQITQIDIDSSESLHVDQSVVVWLQSLKETWETCTAFLDYTVLPRLAQLKPILISRDGRDALGEKTLRRLIPLIDELAEFKSPVSESEFSRLVNRISRDPDGILSKEVWEKYKTDVSWYAQQIFRVEEKEGESIWGRENVTASPLIRFLLSGPASITAIIREICVGLKHWFLLEHTLEGIEDLPELKVYCTERLAKDVVTELFDNIQRHVDDKLKSVTIGLELQCTDDTVTLTVRNDNTQLKTPPGIGLDRLNKRLMPFKGSLKSDTRQTEPGYTYTVQVRFLKGD